MNEELKNIFGNGISVNSEVIPFSHLRYKGNSSTFGTWTIISETPVFFANDEQLYSVCSVDVDIFSKGNYLDIVKAVKLLMKNNEWLWVSDSPEMFEEETGLYHLTMTFEKENYIWQE